MTTRTIQCKVGSTEEEKLVKVKTPVYKDLDITFPFFREQKTGDHHRWVNCISVWNDGYHDRYVESRVHFDEGTYTIRQQFIDEDEVAYDYTSHNRAELSHFTTMLAIARGQIDTRYDEKCGLEGKDA